MMATPQQTADAALHRYQELPGTPEQRIATLVAECLLPPLSHDTRFQDVIDAVTVEMAQ